MPDGNLYLKIGNKKALKIIFNCFLILSTRDLYSVGFGIESLNSGGGWIGEGIRGNNGKKEYDGSYTYSIIITNKDFNDQIRITKWWGKEHITFNYLSIEYEQSYTFFNFDEYIKAVQLYKQINIY